MLNFANGGAGDNQSPSLSFYGNLRDNTAGRLIAQYGLTATLRQDAETYDPTAGTITSSLTDTTIKVVILPSASPDANSSQGREMNTVAKCDVNLLISAKETVAASVIPNIGDTIILNDEELRIVLISSISTGGVDIIYKVGVARG